MFTVLQLKVKLIAFHKKGEDKLLLQKQLHLNLTMIFAGMHFIIRITLELIFLY